MLCGDDIRAVPISGRRFDIHCGNTVPSSPTGVFALGTPFS